VLDPGLVTPPSHLISAISASSMPLRFPHAIKTALFDDIHVADYDR
jgi:hypothetical protein